LAEISLFGEGVESAWSSRPYYYTQYYVDGFRSLRAFSVRLEEGLNVCLGPNGSGKTNFIELLDFVSIFLLRGAAGAVSHVGGLSRVFSQETLRNKIPRLQIHVSGLADLTHHVRSEEERSLFRFDYSVDIRYSKFHSSIFVAAESLKFKSLFWSDLAVAVNSTVGSLALVRRSPVEDEAVRWSVGSRLLSRGPKNPLRFRSRIRRIGSKGESPDEELQTPPEVAPDESFLSSMGALPAINAVRAALSRGRAFNLIPSMARTSDDLSVMPLITTDGSGLSSTLFHMQQVQKKRATVLSARLRRFTPEMLQDVVTWTKLVLPELTEITSVADPHSGKFLSYLVVDVEEQPLRVPLQSVSDGTLKWLSFVCLIVTQGASYSIEEPENYLHPTMQRFLIKLMRESMEEDHPGYFIISTHSESIINQCRPEELLLFMFRNGRTTCKRLNNPELVRKQINETGFGLGYYYAANAIS
jgi:predicted ATPase